ncbi:MAG: OmpH family outer membrane protein [Phycisphaerae bacterium]|nr:OmpH family outer membrane protein [Phycisphaerae bacterium]
MKRTWLTGTITGVTVGLLAFALTESIHAQNSGTPPTGRVACLDVVTVFNEYQRQKDLIEEMNELQRALQEENTQRRQKIDALDAEISALDAADPTLAERVRQLRTMTLDYKVWFEVKQADLTGEVARWSVKVYEEIRAATAEIARREGYDLVLYRGEFEPISMDPELIKEQIRSIKLLYANPAVDISQTVIDHLNTGYRAQPRVKMIVVP